MVHVRDDALYVNIRSNTSAKNTFNFPFQLELTEVQRAVEVTAFGRMMKRIRRH